MTIEQAVKVFLLTKVGITNIVGTRINYATLPQGPTYPYLTFFRVSNTAQHDIDVGAVLFQFDSWALTYIAVVELAIQVKKALQREKSVMTTITVIQGVYRGEDYQYEPDTKLHHIATDIEVFYREL